MYKANMAERRPSVKNFSYADDLLDELEASLSRARLGTSPTAAQHRSHHITMPISRYKGLGNDPSLYETPPDC